MSTVSPSAALIGLLLAVPVVADAVDADDKTAIETVVRSSEQAFAALDCEKSDSYLAPGARWIEQSYPEPAETAAWCRSAAAAGVRIEYKLHDFDIHIHGDVAWVTLIIDGNFHAPTAEARRLMSHSATDPAEWRSTAAESIVLQKFGDTWKMVLGHSSIIPPGTPRTTTMSPSELSDFATRYAAAWSSQKPASLAAFYTEGGSLTVNAGPAATGRAAIAEKAQGFMTAFPDMVVKLDEVHADGSHATFRWIWTGTNTGPGGTGKFVRIKGYEEWTIAADGLIAESKGHYDESEYQRQVQSGAPPAQ